MPHLLYRPHIEHGDKIVTTDFLIRQITVRGRADVNLPVDLANCHVDLVMHDRSFVAPLLFAFSGDEQTYVAPAFGLLDGAVFDADRAAAWRNARISISRQAIKPVGDSIRCLSQFPDESGSDKEVDSAVIKGTARYHALILPAGEATRVSEAGMVQLTVTAGPTAEHRLAIASSGQEILS
ncbi:hypothetical protein SAMN02745824_1507 [Parasphingorhabdus marina DSM 22363]|uniref:Uncharacterized protein n=1 Tax=Parasphingorhabdus marina DSM 22363 TaxID=1123272 RepID=A0A1N6D3Q8_9SPHN|nr:hypothetical protein [Parasphingorhabdus marina]SIN65432.1 hypothetical protein SAMN02745824_1507 [Parasphingorhabdus marina DSM 22363]